VQRVQRPPVRLDETGLGGEITEHRGVLDEGQRDNGTSEVANWSTTSMGSPASSTPSAYRAQLATIAADRRTGLPDTRFARITGNSHFGMRSEESAHNRAMVSRTAGLANRSISVRL
jgi:hypothetical protein